jgi:nitrogen fixation protein FixH
MSAPTAKHPEFTGRHMLLLVVGFFGVIVAVNVGMATLATTSWTGLVVKNSYVASQEFEAKRLAHEAQKAAGWAVTFRVDNGNASLMVTDRLGRPVDLGAVQLSINRPVGGHDDQSIPLQRHADGAYAAALALGTGVWDAWLVATDTPLGQFELHQRLTVEAAGS